MGRARKIEAELPQGFQAKPPPSSAPPPKSVISEDSEIRKQDRRRFREQTIKNLYSGFYLVKHEDSKEYMPYVPPKWFEGLLRDWAAEDAFRAIMLKGRQIYATTTCGMLILDYAHRKPGALCVIYSINQTEANLALLTKCTQPLQERYPVLAGDKNRCHISNKRIEFVRKDGSGGNSAILGGEYTGRGQTVAISLATEFPTLCAIDEGKARNYIGAVIRGSMYGTHFLEGTASEINSSGLMSDMFRKGVELQRQGHKPSQLDFRSYFFPWWCKPENRIAPSEWSQGREIEKACMEYFARLEREEWHQVGRDIIPGGVRLDEAQKRWYYLTWRSSANQSFDDMFGDFPSTMEESMRAGGRAQYLVGAVNEARDEGRICPVPLLESRQVHIGWDIGWNDSTVAVWGQKALDGQHWNILGSMEIDHWQTPELIRWVKEQNFLERTGSPPKIWLPHDAAYYNFTNQKMTGVAGRSVLEDFLAAGLDAKDVKRPTNESQTFAAMREVFGRLIFDEQGCGELLNALRDARIEEIVKDGRMGNKLKKTSKKHLHDATATLAYAILDMSAGGGGVTAGELMESAGAGGAGLQW